jgi:hypothetical protein
MLAATALLASGCAPGDDTAGAAPAPAATVTVTVTQTVTASPEPPTASELAELAGLDDLIDQLDSSGAVPVPPRPPRLKLRVFSDGCGVIRSRPAPGTTYDNLTWSVRDQDGFQVLGRNAEGETRYRYFKAAPTPSSSRRGAVAAMSRSATR